MSKNNKFTMYTSNSPSDSIARARIGIFNAKPTAHITKNRGRLKAYGQLVYLSNGSNFEIELFNPKQTPVLAKIAVNGKSISEYGIIVKPGQRVYLERFLDTPKKFLFETYEVEDPDSNQDVANAIANNGEVTVAFYDESPVISQAPANPWSNPFWYSGYNPYPNYGNTAPCVLYSMTSSNVSEFTNATASVNTAVEFSQDATKTEETGRIEAGSESSQTFENAYGNWSSWTCATVKWKILPESKKPVEAGEIRSYCTNCGTRRKKSSWKFCPNCGTTMIS